MKQSEKLDLILKYLYERRDSGGQYEVFEIMKEIGIETAVVEGRRLADRLKNDEMAIGLQALGMEPHLAITSLGIDYVENDSYSHHGTSIINNTYNLSGQNNSIVQHSTNVSINQQSSNEATELINSIRNTLRQEQINESKLAEIEGCLNEIQAGIAKELKPKFAWKQLSTLSSEFASVGSFVLSLGQIIGAH